MHTEDAPMPPRTQKYRKVVGEELVSRFVLPSYKRRSGGKGRSCSPGGLAVVACLAWPRCHVVGVAFPCRKAEETSSISPSAFLYWTVKAALIATAGSIGGIARQTKHLRILVHHEQRILNLDQVSCMLGRTARLHLSVRSQCSSQDRPSQAKRSNGGAADPRFDGGDDEKPHCSLLSSILFRA